MFCTLNHSLWSQKRRIRELLQQRLVSRARVIAEHWLRRFPYDTELVFLLYHSGATFDECDEVILNSRCQVSELWRAPRREWENARFEAMVHGRQKRFSTTRIHHHRCFIDVLCEDTIILILKKLCIQSRRAFGMASRRFLRIDRTAWEHQRVVCIKVTAMHSWSDIVYLAATQIDSVEVDGNGISVFVDAFLVLRSLRRAPRVVSEDLRRIRYMTPLEATLKIASLSFQLRGRVFCSCHQCTSWPEHVDDFVRHMSFQTYCSLFPSTRISLFALQALPCAWLVQELIRECAREGYGSFWSIG